ncbi:MAG: TetR/AcrR family transcriptional regulator [Bacillota bacterium]
MSSKDKTKKSEETKSRILKAAEQLFIENGFDKTPVSQIVKKAGVAQGTFYLYFPTKDDVLLDIIRDHLRDMLLCITQYINPLIPSLDDIDNVIKAFVQFMNKHKDIMKLLHKSSIANIISEGKSLAEFEGSLLSPIKEWVENGIRKGIIRKQSPQLSTYFIYLLSHTVLEKAFLFEYPAPLETIAPELANFIKGALT